MERHCVSPSKMTSSRKMATTKQARIPGCGSGGCSPSDLLGAGASGAVCPISGAKVPFQEHPGRGPLKNKQSNQHTSPQGQLLRAGWKTNCISKRGCAHVIYGDVWKGTRGGGLSGTRNSLGGCLSVFSPEARLPNALPLPAPPFPMGQHNFVFPNL